MRVPPLVHVSPGGLLGHLPPRDPALLPQARVRHRRRCQVRLVVISAAIQLQGLVTGQLFVYFCCFLTFLRKGAAAVGKVTDAAVEKAKDYAAEQQLNKND